MTAQLKPIPAIHGLGSRVRLIARAIASDPNPAIDWAIGPECPCGHRVVFPDGIPGVAFTESPIGNRIGFLWRVPVDEDALPEAVRRIFTAMQLPTTPRHELGVVFRGLYWDAGSLEDTTEEIHDALAETSGPVPTLCDSMRSEVCALIGPRAIPQTSRPMTTDLDRTESDARPYLTEWWQLIQCRRIVTNCDRSSILWPHRYLYPVLTSASRQ